jgi:hypothetical protein
MSARFQLRVRGCATSMPQIRTLRPPETVMRDWNFARAWLLRSLSLGCDSDSKEAARR